MTEVNPVQKEVTDLQAMQDKLALKPVTDAIEELDKLFEEIRPNLAKVRDGGYKFKKDFEATFQALEADWKGQRRRAQDEVRKQISSLNIEVAVIRNVHRANQSAAARLASLESKVEAAIANAENIYEQTQQQARSLRQKLNDVLWTVTQLQQASFKLTGDEEIIEAVPANWKKPDDKDGVDGVLYLSTRRLIFEQKEEVATKKVLFIATEKQKLQALQWGIPVGSIAQATPAKRGFMGKDDFLTIGCSGDAPFASTEIHLKGESGETWANFITAVQNGSIEQDRLGAAAKDERVVKWGVQPTVMGAQGAPNSLRVYGSYSLKGALPDEQQQMQLTNVLSAKAIDVIGANCPQGQAREAQIAALQGLNLSALIQQAAAPAFEKAGFTLVGVVVEGIS